ncbi:MAG: hypothetical protein GVY27_02295 [Deinococcus-Thermus bacterium]|jgi:polyisoprenoid-binding protein YceI|nr:hypothetical protein [Deinococcota bacterium]
MTRPILATSAPVLRSLAIAAVLAVAALAPAAPAAAQAVDGWVVDHDESRLGFTAFQGGAFQGRFTDWQADIAFSPDALDQSQVTVTVNLASIETGSSDRDSTVVDDAWFDVDAHPRAVFEATTFRTADGENAYEAVGDLSIKGVTREVVLPFTLAIDGDTATVEGGFTLDRTNWNLGTGDWSTEELVGFPVEVEVSLVAQRAPAD